MEPMTFTITMKKSSQYIIFMIIFIIIKVNIYLYLKFMFNIAHKILYKNK
jgi:hypothetical protein